MSDTNISIVPKISSYPNNKEKAKEVLNWLISHDIVKSNPSNCILSTDKFGYEVSEGARRVTDSTGMTVIEFDEDGDTHETPMDDYIPVDLETNGLEIITERSVFISDEGFVEQINCPKCQSNLEIDDFDFTNWSNKISDHWTCPNCKEASEINEFHFEPEWGFSDLGFKFWNWPPFKEEFIGEFKKILNCEIRIIEERI